MIKRVVAAVGNPVNYIGYAIPFFVMYLLYNLYLTDASPLQNTVRNLLGFGYGWVLNPFVLAGLYGAIHEQQQTHGESGAAEFLPNALRFFWRFALINLIFDLFIVLVSIVTAIVFPAVKADALSSYLDIPCSAIVLFWFTSVVFEGRVFPGLSRALKILLANPTALVLGLAWGLFRYADNVALKSLNLPGSLALSAADAAVITVIRILATAYVVALYRQVRGEALETQAAVTAVPGEVPPATDNSLINTGLGFALVSFLPLFHLAALVLGILGIRRRGSFSLKSAIAICLGGFFTAFYALLLVSVVASVSPVNERPGYGFLVQANPSLAKPVALLEQNSFEEARAQLQSTGGNPGSDWTVDCALAIAKWGSNDLAGALLNFQAADRATPDRSEFYYYYGLALLDNGQPANAAEQFRNAVQHNPGLGLADRYASLANAAYTPPQAITIAFTVLILLVLFSVHEYGHAYTAWKLGDDTAKSQGRLTLNPVRHLDYFGSIILPAILLLQQSNMVFGWARPVPVNPANFKNPRKDYMLVAFAGPAVNVLVAMLCFLILGCLTLVLRLFWPGTLTWHFVSPSAPIALVGAPFPQELSLIVIFIKEMMYTSLVLGFFNLLPIPPLDGSWILSGILPPGLRNVFEGVRRFGYLIFLAVIALTPIIDYYVSIPVIVAWNGLHLLVSTVGIG